MPYACAAGGFARAPAARPPAGRAGRRRARAAPRAVAQRAHPGSAGAAGPALLRGGRGRPARAVPLHLLPLLLRHQHREAGPAWRARSRVHDNGGVAPGWCWRRACTPVLIAGAGWRTREAGSGAAPIGACPGRARNSGVGRRSLPAVPGCVQINAARGSCCALPALLGCSGPGACHDRPPSGVADRRPCLRLAGLTRNHPVWRLAH